MVRAQLLDGMLRWCGVAVWRWLSAGVPDELIHQSATRRWLTADRRGAGDDTAGLILAQGDGWAVCWWPDGERPWASTGHPTAVAAATALVDHLADWEGRP